MNGQRLLGSHRYRILSTHGKVLFRPSDRAIAMKTLLGNAIYWAGCVISALLVMVGLNSAFYANSDFERLFTLVGWLVLAGVALLIARTVRRVMVTND
jgi:hypothetical protein